VAGALIHGVASLFVSLLKINFNFLQPQYCWMGNDDITWFHGRCKVMVFFPLSDLTFYFSVFCLHETLTSSFVICSVRVANELGKGSSKAAKFSILVSVLTSLVIGFVLFLFFLFLREKLAYVFTTSEEVADAVGDLSPLLAVAILLNSVQPVLSGTFHHHLLNNFVSQVLIRQKFKIEY